MTDNTTNQGPHHPGAKGAAAGAGVGGAEHLRERHEGERAHGQHGGIAGSHPTAEGAAVGAGVGEGAGMVERHHDNKQAQRNAAAGGDAGVPGSGAAGVGAASGAGAGAGAGGTGGPGNASRAPGMGQKVMGRVEQATGTVLNNETMKARGLDKEGKGLAQDQAGAQGIGANRGVGGAAGY